VQYAYQKFIVTIASLISLSFLFLDSTKRCVWMSCSKKIR